MSTGKRNSGTAEDDGAAGATATFPYDRLTVERFREAFPRARWNDDLKAWFVPGKTADRRIDRWLEREAAASDAYADLKGRDAFAFDPIHSGYLIIREEDLMVRTPYSRTIVEEMREVPFARWEPHAKAWIVPFRAYEELRRRWDRIEAAARRNEPAERRKRQAERRGSEQDLASRARAAERRRRRYPVRADSLPPLGRPVMTAIFGIVVFTGIDGELADAETLSAHYAAVPAGDDLVWGRWRVPTFGELIRTWPARPGPPEGFAGDTWRQPTINELRAARNAARSRERRRESGV